jgi:O-antigen/teichoic acid export membrane protein
MLVKFLADSIHNDLGQERQILNISAKLFVLAVIVICTPLYAYSDKLAAYFLSQPSFGPYFKLALLVTAFNALFSILHSALRGTESFGPLVVSNTIGRVVRLGMIVSIASYATLDIFMVLVANGAAAVVIVIIDLWILKNVLKNFRARQAQNRENNRKLFSKIVSYSAWMYGSRLIGVIYDNTNVLILNFMRAATAAGNYSAALNLLRPFEFFPETLVQVMLPKISGIRTKDELKRYIVRTFLIGLIAGAPLILLVIFPRFSVTLLFGNQYAEAAGVVAIMAVNMILMIALNPMAILLHRLGKHRIFAVSSLLTVTLNLAFNAILIPKYGAAGSAVSSLLVYICSQILILSSIFSAVKKFSGDLI